MSEKAPLWTARRSNQPIIKEINPEYSLEGLTVKLKLQYFGHLMWRADSLENTLTLGKIEGKRRGQQRMRWLDAITDLMGQKSEQTLEDSEGQTRLACCSPWGHKELDRTEWLNNSKEIKQKLILIWAIWLTVFFYLEITHGHWRNFEKHRKAKGKLKSSQILNTLSILKIKPPVIYFTSKMSLEMTEEL